MSKILIIGTGGHSKVVSDEISRLKNIRLLVILTKKKKLAQNRISLLMLK